MTASGALSRPAALGVAIPTYKRPEMLKLLLDSIPSDVPVAVSDNGAFLTPEFMAGYPHVEFCATATVLPMFTNWNAAARLLSTEWVVLPSDDDIYLDGAFDKARAAIERHSAADLIVFGHHLVDGDGKAFHAWAPTSGIHAPPHGFFSFRHGVTARMPSVLFKRSLYDQLGGFKESFRLTAADSDFVQRATLLANTVFVPEIISGYRVWTGGLTVNRIASSEWMQEVDAWCASVAAFDRQLGTRAYAPDLRDEIMVQNLLAGARILRERSGRRATFDYLRSQGIPLRAKRASYMQLLRTLI